MRGQTNRSRLNISPREAHPRLIDAINRLPFGFVGFSLSRIPIYDSISAGVWEAVEFSTTLLDSDLMVNAAGTKAKVPDACDGVYVATFAGKTTSSTASFRVRVGTTTLFTVGVEATLGFPWTSHPFALNVGDVVDWQFNVSATGINLAADASLSIHRIGLLP